ncbi:hypothetical protein [Chryseobacterium ginsenosidimutans]|uniref:hypothetical protein n=1 Tax=Chryseobacterium ginsenosidimutans TaxID=687846 RepID=UPI0031CE2E96
MKELTKSHINIGIDGEQWIFTRRQKTDTSTRVPLLPVAKELVLRYENHLQCVNSNVSLIEIKIVMEVLNVI